MRILSYNLNGIRAALKKDLVGFLKEHNYDIVCFQETKAQPDQVDNSEFEALGYQTNWFSAEKKGYSGVATYSKNAPDFVSTGCDNEEFDKEGRVIRTDFGDLTILNCYFPSGTSGEERQEAKYRFLDHFFKWALELRKTRPNIVIVGDYNIAHTEIDIHNPKSKNSGFLPDERAWMTKWFESGFTDSFRTAHPEKQEYSWWSYRFGSRGKNKGWRIDYQSVTDNLKDKIKDAGHHNEAVHSDHCGVWLDLKTEDG